MMLRHTSGVSDYDWSKWSAGLFPLTEDLKTKAAEIADKFTSAGDVQKYFETSNDPNNLKLVVQYAAGARKAKIEGVEQVASSAATADPTGSGIIRWDLYKAQGNSWNPPKPPETPPVAPSSTETPWYVYAGAAALLLVLLRK